MGQANKTKTKIRISIAVFTALLVALAFAGLAIGIAGAGGPTYVSGPITSDTTWTLEGSPYIAVGSVLVNNGVTLTIEPGVTVKFNKGFALQVDGTLIARGTSSDKITFTSNKSTPAAGDWGYILFSDSSTDYDDGRGSILEYCVVEYAGGVSVDNNGAVRINNAHPFINYCTIRNNKATGIYAWDLSENLKISDSTISDNTATDIYPGEGGGIYVAGGTVDIFNNTISHNSALYGGGIYTEWCDSASIYNNTISNNNANYEGGGIRTHADDIVTVSNNIIIKNTAEEWSGGGIHVGYTDSVTISNNIIGNNIADDYGGGICIYWQWGHDNFANILNNIIFDNNANSGGGIAISDGDIDIATNILANSIVRNTANKASAIYYCCRSNQNIKYNTITENQATGSKPTYTVYVSSHPNFNYNNIFNNTATYELWNDNPHGSADVNAENNWWGTATESEILAKIYDWFDDSTKGIVDYSPYLSAPDTTAPISPPTGLNATAGDSVINLSWSANPEADLAGYKVYYDTDSGYPYDGTGANEGSSGIDVGDVTSCQLSGLTNGVKYYVAITAYDTTGDEGWYSNEVSGTPHIIIPPLTISIYTDKPTYTAGEKMHLGLDVKNPLDSAQKVSLDIYLETSMGRNLTLIDTTVTLPAKLNYSNPHFKVFTLPGIPAGTYTWHAILDDPVTGEIICEDTAPWEFVSTGAPIEDIAEMLEQTATVIDFGE